MPRSIIPHFQPRNLTHNVPLGRTEQDEEILQKLKALKVLCVYWVNKNSNTTHIHYFSEAEL